MHLRSIKPRSRFSAPAAVLCVTYLLSLHSSEAATKDYPIIFKPGQKSAYTEGQFSRKVHEVYFSFHAHAGQHLFVKITPLTPELITAGVVIYPSGKQDGGPGGIVFNSDLTETGKYRIRVTQRQNQTNGKFRLLVEVHPQSKDGPGDGE